VGSNGDVYKGQWKCRHKDGKGVYTYPTGATYTGDWKDDKKTGYGTYRYGECCVQCNVCFSLVAAIRDVCMDVSTVSYFRVLIFLCNACCVVLFSDWGSICWSVVE
jgi:hypothetical protein